MLILGSLIAMLILMPGVQFYFHIGWIPSYLIGINVTVTLLMAYDKLAARQGWARVPEKVLHFYTFAGGTPLAYLSQKIFHHKTIKRSFQRTFYLILSTQVILIALWFLWNYELL